jgi:dephospho-CoA kinase
MAPDGLIDRKKLGSIVFADRDAMRTLEALIWPQVQSEIEKRIQRIRSEWLTSSSNDASLSFKEPVVVVEAAVLLDAGWQHTFLDAVWVITVSQEVALHRMMETRGLSREEALKRIEAQQSRRGIGNLSDESAKGVVTAQIDNSGTLEELHASLSVQLKNPAAWYEESGIK